MRVLLVAPQTPDLLYPSAEVQAIWQSDLDVDPRIGEVRHADVVSAVGSNSYDVFWFCGHATKDGLMLTDGLLSASELTPLIRGKFSLVVLNSCDGQQTAQMLQNETGATIIATIIEVPDRLAFQTGALFARELARTGDVFAAYNNARPGNNRTYVILGWSNSKVVDNDTLNRRLDKLELSFNETKRTLARVVALMDGDSAYRIVGIPDQLAAYIKSNEDWKEATKQHILNHDNRLKAIESSNSSIVITRSTFLFMVVIGTICLVLAFLLLTWLQSAG